MVLCWLYQILMQDIDMNIVIMKGIICAAAAIIVFLPIIITSYWKRKRNPLQKYQYGLAAYSSIADLWIAVLGTIVFYLALVFGICIWDQNSDFWGNFLGILIFGIFALVGTYGCICGMLEVIILEADSLTIITPLFPVKHINFYDLTHIRYYENRVDGYRGGRMILDGYIHKKRVFSIDDSFSEFCCLYMLLEETGKMERPEIKEEFVISETRDNISNAVLGVVLFGGCAVASVVYHDEVELLYRIFMICAALVAVLDLIEKLMWKVTVTYSTIYIRSKTGRVSSCLIRDITSVIEEKNYLVLYSGEEKVLKVCKDYKNLDLLRNRLEAEQTAFYYTEKY